MSRSLLAILVLSTLLPGAAHASERYSLPWQLRSVALADAARAQGTGAAFEDPNGNLDVALVTVLALDRRLDRDSAAWVRLGVARDDAPGAALDGASFANPVVGATYARSLGGYRLALFGAATIPVGAGAGATRAAATARPADEAMFEIDDVAGTAGADLAWLGRGFTAQVEAAVVQHVRVRGAGERLRTDVATGLHLGYFLGEAFSVSGDLRWRHRSSRGAGADAVTVAVGPRLQLPLGERGSIAPGLSFVRGLDGRGIDAPLTAVQLDVPVVF